MDDHQKEALDTLRNFSLQILLISAGVFGIVGGFITSSDKLFQSTQILVWSLSFFAISALFGYFVHGTIIGLLNNQNFDPHNRLLQICALLQISAFLLGGVFFVIFVANNLTSEAKAQEIPETILENKYTNALDKILNKWNQKQLVLTKSDYSSEFSAAIQRRHDKPEYEFEAASTYIPTMEERWAQLPETLSGERSLTFGARLILIGATYDRTLEIAKILNNPEDFQSEFGMSLYLVLGAGQEEAIQAGRDLIDARSILAAEGEFRSVPYPFCCWRTPR